MTLSEFESGLAAVFTAEEIAAAIYPVADNFHDWNQLRKMEKILPTINLLKELNMKANFGVNYIDTYRDRTKGVSAPRFSLDKRGRFAIGQLGGILLELSRSSDRIIMPEAGPEMNEDGIYDFKSLGFGPSYIAQKFLQEAPAFLSMLEQYQIPYKGKMVFADWGMETEITARDTYGRLLPQNEIMARFDQSFQATSSLLGSGLFSPYKLQAMSEFLATRLGDPAKANREFQQRFLEERQARKLLELYQKESFGVNKRRLGLTREQNDQSALQTLSEYSTLGAAIDRGIMVAAESRLASLAYNVFRRKGRRLPVVFLKGDKPEDRGVNIL